MTLTFYVLETYPEKKIGLSDYRFGGNFFHKLYIFEVTLLKFSIPSSLNEEFITIY